MTSLKRREWGRGLDEDERRGKGKKIIPKNPSQAGQGAGNLGCALHTAGIEVESGRPHLRAGKLKGENEETKRPVSKHHNATKAVGTFPLIASFIPGFCVSSLQKPGVTGSL